MSAQQKYRTVEDQKKSEKKTVRESVK